MWFFILNKFAPNKNDIGVFIFWKKKEEDGSFDDYHVWLQTVMQVSFSLFCFSSCHQETIIIYIQIIDKWPNSVHVRDSIYHQELNKNYLYILS